MSAKPEETSTTSPVEEAEAVVAAAVEEEKTASLKDRVITTLKNPALYKRAGLFVAGVATTAAIFVITKKGELEPAVLRENVEIIETENAEDTEEG